MARFTQSIRIAAPPEAVFDFHADPRNIVKVAAPPVQARLLEPYDVPLRLGSIVRLRVVLLGMLPQLWESEIVVWLVHDGHDLGERRHHAYCDI